jgi:sugar phosphate isomerase/epimerase
MPLDSRLHVHVPWAELRERLPALAGRRLDPEIYFSGGDLSRIAGGEDAELPAALAATGLRCSAHGPFADLAPGAADAGLRDLTTGRLRAALLAAAPYRPRTVVFHPGYVPQRDGEHPRTWLRNSLRTWAALLPLPEPLAHTWITIENIYEAEPDTLVALLRELPSPPFGFCFDTGHFRLFSRVPLEAWIGALGPWIREVHLHDNAGLADDHLPPGQGGFDFAVLLRLLASLPQAVIGTLEMHRDAHVDEALAAMAAYGVG